MNDAEAVMRGEHARQITENPAFARAIGEMRAALSEAILLTGPKDVEMREQLYTMGKMLPMFEGVLLATINGGTTAAVRMLKAQPAEEKKASPSRRKPR